MRRYACTTLALTACLTVVFGQDGPLKSGPQPGQVLPAPFDAFVVHSKTAAGRQHCLICQNALSPAVLVFAREPEEGKDEALDSLLKKLDETLEKNQKAGLNGFVFVLSPDARSSVTETGALDTEKLLEEATKRKELYARLKARAEPLKLVDVAAYPALGPKGYNVDAKAEVTVIFYHRLKVKDNWAFAEGKLTENDVTTMMKKVDEHLTAATGKKK